MNLDNMVIMASAAYQHIVIHNIIRINLRTDYFLFRTFLIVAIIVIYKLVFSKLSITIQSQR